MSSFYIKNQSIPVAKTEVFYEVQFEVDGYPIPTDVLWNTTNRLPKGFTLNAQTGVLSGITLTLFQGSITITAKSTELAQSCYTRVVLYVVKQDEPPKIDLSINELTFSYLSSSITYSIALKATGGVAPYKWTIDNLPIGMSLHNECIVGSPSLAGGKFPLSVNVKDSAGSEANTFKWIDIK